MSKNLFKKGEAPRPPPGSKLGKSKKFIFKKAFMDALEKDFAEHGVAAIKIVRIEEPKAYLQIIASILPKEIILDANPLEDMSDEELSAAIVKLKALRDAGVHRLDEDEAEEPPVTQH